MHNYSYKYKTDERTALVLPGGGAKGAFQAGVLQKVHHHIDLKKYIPPVYEFLSSSPLSRFTILINENSCLQAALVYS